MAGKRLQMPDRRKVDIRFTPAAMKPPLDPQLGEVIVQLREMIDYGERSWIDLAEIGNAGCTWLTFSALERHWVEIDDDTDTKEFVILDRWLEDTGAANRRVRSVLVERSRR